MEILCCENGVEIYKKICEINIGDEVKTYKQGNKKVTHIKGFHYRTFNKDIDTECLYKIKDTNIIVTGGHSILVDELKDHEIEKQNNYYSDKIIEDKMLLLACVGDVFEKITDDQEYTLYHLVLENEDSKTRYGIYLQDNILSESCSEAAFLRLLG